MSLWKVIPKNLCTTTDLNDLSQFGFVLVIRETHIEVYRYIKNKN